MGRVFVLMLVLIFLRGGVVRPDMDRDQRAREYIEELSDENDKVRRNAAVALGRMKYAGAVNALIERLERAPVCSRKGQLRIQKEAAWALGEIRSPTAVRALLDSVCLEDNMAAARALANYGEPYKSQVGEILIKKLQHRDRKIRIRVVEALQWFADKKAIPVLIEMLKDVDTPNIYIARTLKAIDAAAATEILVEAAGRNRDVTFLRNSSYVLSRLSCKRAIPILSDLLEHDDPGIVANAVEGLGELEAAESADALYRLMKTKDTDIRRRVITALARLNDIRVIEGFDDPDENVRFSAMGGVRTHGDDRMMGYLLGLFKDKECGFRRDIADILMQWSDRPLIIDFFLKGLKDEDRFIRETAARGLMSHRIPKAMAPLYDAILDEDTNVRQYAIGALLGYEKPRTVDSLLDDLGNPDPRERLFAVKALKWEMGLEIVEPVIRLLRDPHPYVREAAMEFLYDHSDGHRGPPSPGLGFMFPEEDQHRFELETRKKMEMIDDPVIIEQLLTDLESKNPRLSHDAARLLARIKNPATVPRLIQLLDRSQFDIIPVLGAIKDRRAVIPLLDVLHVTAAEVRRELQTKLPAGMDMRKYDSYLDYRHKRILSETIWALAEIDDPRAIEPIISLLKNRGQPFFPRDIRSLVRFRDQRVIRFLETLLDDSDQNTRMEAAYALLKMNHPQGRQFLADLGKNHGGLLELLTREIRLRRDRHKAELLLPCLEDDRESLRLATLCSPESLASVNILERIERLQQDKNGNYDLNDAAVVLSRLNDEQAVAPLVDLLIRMNRNCIDIVVDSLEKNKSSRVLTLVLPLLSHERPEIVLLAVEILAERRETVAADSLVRITGHKNWRVRMEVATALGRLAEPWTIPHIFKLLEDEMFYVRAAAERALCRMNKPEARPYLEAAFLHREPAIRRAVKRVMARIRGNHDNEPLAERREENEGILDIVIAQDRGLSRWSYHDRHRRLEEVSFADMINAREVVRSRDSVFAVTVNRLFKLDRDLEKKLELKVGPISAVASCSRALLVSTVGKLFALDTTDLTVLDILDLQVSREYRKDAHDILVNHNTAYLLDNVAYPIYILKVDATDTENLSIEKKILITGVNQHLQTQAVDPGRDEWIIVQSSFSMAGRYLNCLVYSAATGQMKKGFKMYSDKRMRGQGGAYLKGMVSSSPPWCVVSRNRRYFLATMDTGLNKIDFPTQLDLEIATESPWRDRVNIKRYQTFVYISINNHLVVADISGQPVKVLSLALDEPINDLELLH